MSLSDFTVEAPCGENVLSRVLEEGPFILAGGDNFFAQLANENTKDNEPIHMTRLPEYIYPKIKKMYTTPGRYFVLTYEENGKEVVLKIGTRANSDHSGPGFFIRLNTEVFGEATIAQMSFEYEYIYILTSDHKLWHVDVNQEELQHVVQLLDLKLDGEIVALSSAYKVTLLLTSLGDIYYLKADKKTTKIYSDGKATKLFNDGCAYSLFAIINDELYCFEEGGVTMRRVENVPFHANQIVRLVGNSDCVFYMTRSNEIYMSTNLSASKNQANFLGITLGAGDRFEKIKLPEEWLHTQQYPVVIGCPCSLDFAVLTNKGEVWVAGTSDCGQLGNSNNMTTSRLSKMLFAPEYQGKKHLQVTQMSFGYWSAYFMFSEARSTTIPFSVSKTLSKTSNNSYLFDIRIICSS